MVKDYYFDWFIFFIFLQTREANSQGNRQLAEKNSQTARKLNHAALGIGLSIIIIYIVLSFVVGFSH